MADQFDRASEREQMDRDLAIQSALRAGNANRLLATGTCHNCADPLPAGGLFCDADCRDDHQARARARRF